MRGKVWPCILWVTSWGLTTGVATATEPVASESQRQMQKLRFDDRPNWLRPVDNLAREGLKIVCLRPGRDSDLVLGAHPDGYVGVFTTLSRGRRQRGSC